ADSLAATPPAWSATSPDQICTRSNLKPMIAAPCRKRIDLLDYGASGRGCQPLEVDRATRDPLRVSFALRPTLQYHQGAKQGQAGELSRWTGWSAFRNPRKREDKSAG